MKFEFSLPWPDTVLLNLSAIILTIFLLTLIPSASCFGEGAVVTTAESAWKAQDLDGPSIDREIKQISNRLAELPADVTENSPDGRRKTVFKERIALLRQLGKTLVLRNSFKPGKMDTKKSEQALDSKLRDLEKKAAPQSPANPTVTTFEKLEASLTEKLKVFQSLAAERNQTRERLQNIPEWVLREKQRQDDVREEIRKLSELLKKADESEQRNLNLGIENTEISSRLANERIETWNLEQDFEKKYGARLDKGLELAQRIYEREELTHRLYRESLDKLQQKRLRARQNDLAQKKLLEKSATTPKEQFLAHWDVRLAVTRKNVADWGQVRTQIVSAISAMERRIKEERAELENLEAMVKRVGSQGMAADLLKSTFRIMEQRRRDLQQPTRHEITLKLAEAQIRRLAIDRDLNGLHENWQNDLTTANQSLTNSGMRVVLEKSGHKLFDANRQGLRDEKRALFELNVDQRQLELLTIERTKLLDDLERFVLLKVFWIQDAEPLGIATVRGLWSEFAGSEQRNSISAWIQRLMIGNNLEQLAQSVSHPELVTPSLILLIVLVVAMVWSRQRIARAIVSLLPDKDQNTGRTLWLAPLLAGLSEAALWPAYIIIIGFILQNANLSEDVGTLLARVLFHVALFMFLWRYSWRLFRPGGMAETVLEMPRDLTASLFFAARLLIAANLVLLMPWIIFRGPPFLFEHLPRISYTAYECTAAIVVFMLIRSTSPLVRHAFGNVDKKFEQESRLAQNWGLISGLMLIFMIGVVSLDILGYRFGAAYLTRNGLSSLIVIFLIVGGYRLLATGVHRLLKNRWHLDSSAPGEKNKPATYESAKSVQHFLKVFFIIAAMFILSSFWGVNEQTIAALNDYALYDAIMADGHMEIVSIADLLHCLVILVVTVWLVRNIAAVFELIFLARFNLDQGLRYAILTISRYLVVLIGVPLSLSALHVDVGKIAWLAAAISVGIGFGLQEIVANFVSGIILLVERPVRVGDRITVGTTRGEVRRINIRATTVINREHQEIIIPNRDLITKEVINWTLSCNHVRLKIPIGVAYGSDIEKVRELLLDIAKREPDVLSTPPARAYFISHGASSLDFELRVFYTNPDNLGLIKDRINSAINKSFVSHNIGIPFPQQDVHIIRSGIELFDQSNHNDDKLKTTA